MLGDGGESVSSDLVKWAGSGGEQIAWKRRTGKPRGSSTRWLLLFETIGVCMETGGGGRCGDGGAQGT